MLSTQSTHGNDARGIVFSSVLEVTTSSYRCCLDLYRPDIFTPASIFWGYIEKMRFPGGLVSEIWELKWEVGTMRMRESARVGPGQGWPALCCLPHNNSSERASVQCYQVSSSGRKISKCRSCQCRWWWWRERLWWRQGESWTWWQQRRQQD